MIREIPSDLKRLSKILRLKKNDLKDTGYCFSILEILIQVFDTLQNEKKTKPFKAEGSIYRFK